MAAIENGTTAVRHVEYRMRRSDGLWIWFEDRGHVIESDADGRPRVTAGILTNIAARHAERLAVESERSRLQALLQTIPDMVWLKDPDGVYLDCNPRAARLFGRPASEVIGRTDLDLLPNPVIACALRADDEAAIRAGGARVSLRKRCTSRWPHRALRDVENAGADADGRLIGVLGIAHDVTEREGTRRQIARQNRSLHMLTRVAQVFFTEKPPSACWAKSAASLLKSDAIRWRGSMPVAPRAPTAACLPAPAHCLDTSKPSKPCSAVASPPCRQASGRCFQARPSSSAMPLALRSRPNMGCGR